MVCVVEVTDSQVKQDVPRYRNALIAHRQVATVSANAKAATVSLKRVVLEAFSLLALLAF